MNQNLNYKTFKDKAKQAKDERRKEILRELSAGALYAIAGRPETANGHRAEIADAADWACNYAEHQLAEWEKRGWI